MAVITPSRSFEGSDLSTNVFGRTLKEGIRTVSFRDDRNKDGNFFFILPPYRTDAMGRGVSWKVLAVRDNFGIDVKETFSVPRNCPVAYFAGRVKQFYPDYARVEQTTQNGRQVKRYPPFGRPANKVLFNVAYMRDLALGAHVLILPQFGGGEHIEAWHRRRMPDGSEAPLLNNPEAAIPVFIQLKKDAIGQPWIVTPEASKTYKLPAELADANYLYNLEEAVFYPEIDYLIDKLHSFVPAEIFNRCMQGYQLPNGTVIGASAAAGPVSVPSPVAIPSATGQAMVASAPLPLTPQPIALPQATIPRAVVPTFGGNVTPPEVPLPQVTTVNTSNPMAVPAGVQPAFTIEQARSFLGRPTQGT